MWKLNKRSVKNRLFQLKEEKKKTILSLYQTLNLLPPLISHISNDKHCTTEQYVAEIDDDIALSPHEIIEGLNAGLLNKAVVDELEVVEDEQA